MWSKSLGLATDIELDSKAARRRAKEEKRRHADFAVSTSVAAARPPAPDGPASGGGWRFLRASERLPLGQPAEGQAFSIQQQLGCSVGDLQIGHIVGKAIYIVLKLDLLTPECRPMLYVIEQPFLRGYTSVGSRNSRTAAAASATTAEISGRGRASL